MMWYIICEYNNFFISILELISANEFIFKVHCTVQNWALHLWRIFDNSKRVSGFSWHFISEGEIIKQMGVMLVWHSRNPSVYMLKLS